MTDLTLTAKQIKQLMSGVTSFSPEDLLVKAGYAGMYNPAFCKRNQDGSMTFTRQILKLPNARPTTTA